MEYRLAPSAADLAVLLIGVAWMYVVLMVALVQATGPDGHWLGALATVLFWGALPLAIVAYLAFAPARRRAAAGPDGEPGDLLDPDGRRHPTGDAVAPERKEP